MIENKAFDQLKRLEQRFKESEWVAVLSGGFLTADDSNDYGHYQEVVAKLSELRLWYLGFKCGTNAREMFGINTEVLSHPFNICDKELYSDLTETKKRKIELSARRSNRRERAWYVLPKQWKLDQLGMVFEVLMEMPAQKFELDKEKWTQELVEFSTLTDSFEFNCPYQSLSQSRKKISFEKWRSRFISTQPRDQRSVFERWEIACGSFGLDSERLFHHLVDDTWAGDSQLDSKNADQLDETVIRDDYAWIRLRGHAEIALTSTQAAVIRALHKSQTYQNVPITERELLSQISSDQSDNSYSIKKRFRGREEAFELLIERMPGGLIRLRHRWPPYVER